MVKVSKTRTTTLLFYRSLHISLMSLVGLSTFVALLLLLGTSNHQTTVVQVAVLTEASLSQTIPSSCNSKSTIFAAYQAWHGLNNHNLFRNAPYRVLNDSVITRQIEQARAQCIDAFVVDWYGPKASLRNEIDRTYINSVTLKMMDHAVDGIKIGLMYNVDTLSAIPTSTVESQDIYITQIISDLSYARDIYFTKKESYLSINGEPVLFIFAHEKFDISWDEIKSKLGISLLLFSNADMQAADNSETDQLQCEDGVDGFYAWVRPTNGKWDGSDWGEEYMKKFYTAPREITHPCHNKIMIGGVWPGFDDNLAYWRSAHRRVIPRNCGNTWKNLWELANTYAPEYILISTFNDFEEGTDVEYGVMNLSITGDSVVLPDHATLLSAALADCDNTAYSWEFGDGHTAKGSPVTHTYPKAGNYTVVVTATHATATVTASATIIVSTTTWMEDFTPIKPSWSQSSARWEISGTQGILRQTSRAETFGKVESEVIRVNATAYPYLIIEATDIVSDASYTVQLLDKSRSAITETNKITVANVITGITRNDPKLIWVNYSQKMGWHDSRIFTINLWINGKDKSATIKRIAIVNINDKRLSSVDPVYLPIIVR